MSVQRRVIAVMLMQFAPILWGVTHAHAKLDTAEKESTVLVGLFGLLNIFIFLLIDYNYTPDINECMEDNMCSTDADCVNTPGTFECNCRLGFAGDGFICSGTLTMNVL